MSNFDFQEELALSGLQRALPPLENHLKDIKHLYEQEEQGTTKSSYKFKYISEIDTSSRLLVAPGLKVRLFINGRKRDLGPIKMFINPYDLSKGSKTKEDVIQKFLDLINMNENITALFGIKASKVYVKRAFFIDGRELKDISMLGPEQELWLSLGEGFIPVESEFSYKDVFKNVLLNKNFSETGCHLKI